MNWFLSALLLFWWSIPITTAIHAGKLAAPGELPYIVRVIAQKPNFAGVGMCGGTIISSNLVVTAAHCLKHVSEGKEGSSIKIFAGETRSDHRSSTTTQVRTVRKVFRFEETKTNLHTGLYDIAILHLSYPLIFNKFVRPLAVPDRYDTFGANATIGGWGVVMGERGQAPSSDSLLKDEVTIWDQAQCRKRHKELKDIILADYSYAEIIYPQYFLDDFDGDRDGFICAGGNVNYPCKGDSGGPLVCTSSLGEYLCGVVFGVLSMDCLPNAPPGLYTNVKPYAEYIQQLLVQLKPMFCNHNEFACGSTCVHESKRCNRVNDCDQGSDEIGCGMCSSSSNEFLCNTRDRCIDVAYICDGDNNCADGSDEFGCAECKVNEFTCENGTCVSATTVCDGVKHCQDGSDEIGCGECSLVEFRCRNWRCVNETKLCDGRDDCKDGSDELHCGKCSENQFQCTDGACIGEIAICNGENDCTDGADEENCSLCDANSFRCGNGVCLDASCRCDGHLDCADASDENNCHEPDENVRTISSEMSDSAICKGQPGPFCSYPAHYPLLTWKDTTINFLVNTTNRLCCQVAGFDFPSNLTPEMKWSRDGQAINISGRVSTQRIGLKLYLMFENISTSDDGVYKCSAWNSLGRSEYFVRVMVEVQDLSCSRNLDHGTCLKRGCYFIPDYKICVKTVVPNANCGLMEQFIASNRFSYFFYGASGAIVIVMLPILLIGVLIMLSIHHFIEVHTEDIRNFFESRNWDWSMFCDVASVIKSYATPLLNVVIHVCATVFVMNLIASHGFGIKLLPN